MSYAGQVATIGSTGAGALENHGRLCKEPPRILLVDDEIDICYTLSQHLKLEGFECALAGSASEALEKLDGERYHLMIADIRMPQISGLSLLEQVTEKHPHTAVVMMTGMNDRDTAVRALETGAYGYITKPFKNNELIINVVNALQRQRLEQLSRDYQDQLEQRISKQTEDIRLSHEEIALRLIEAQSVRHDETGAHVRRIGLYSEVMGRQLGMTEEAVHTLRLAAPMHDVGKIGISDTILLKPGGLTDSEYAIMKQHTIIGAKILSGSELPLLNTAHDIALAHHEHWNGHGYPRGLSGIDIPRSARIVAILDVYDALINERVYRKAMPEADTLALIAQGCGAQFDPEIYEAFLKVLPELRDIRNRVPEPSRHTRQHPS